jgi:hypothetical protein
VVLVSRFDWRMTSSSTARGMHTLGWRPLFQDSSLSPSPWEGYEIILHCTSVSEHSTDSVSHLNKVLNWSYIRPIYYILCIHSIHLNVTNTTTSIWLTYPKIIYGPCWQLILPRHLLHTGILFSRYFTLKIEVKHSPEMSVHIWTTWHYIPEGGNIHN